MGRRIALGLVAAMLAATACTHWSAPAAPRNVPIPRMFPGDSAQIRAGKLAEYIQRRWPRVTVPSFLFATHSDPAANAMPSGPLPTLIGAPKSSLFASWILLTVPSS